MLHEVLSKEACANCKFCCTFRRKSLWELPRMPEEFAEKYRTGHSGEPIAYITAESGGQRYVTVDLRDKYKTDDPEEEAPCPFLDPDHGCILPEEDKPFDCKIWPLRYMEMPDSTLKVCLTPTCPEINKVPEDRMRELVSSGLGSVIADHASKYPFMVKEYKQGFTVLE